MHSAYASDDGGTLADPGLVGADVDAAVEICATRGCTEPVLHAVVTSAPHATLATTTDRLSAAQGAAPETCVWGERRDMSMLVFLFGRSVFPVVRQQQ
jgi:hypothetical protein